MAVRERFGGVSVPGGGLDGRCRECRERRVCRPMLLGRNQNDTRQRDSEGRAGIRTAPRQLLGLA